MSNIPISSLPLTASISGSEEVPIVQGGTTKRTTTGAIASLASSGAGSSAPFVMATSDVFFPGSRVLSPQASVTTVTDGGGGGNITVGIATNGIGNTQLRQGGALSVIGNSSNATANVVDIVGTSAQILRVNDAGTALGFGSIDLAQSASVGSSILGPSNGGTGVNNGSSTLTLGGSLTTSGAFASTFTMTGLTSVTFPTSGTLATTSGPSLPSVNQGDLLYGSATNVLSTLPKSATATNYLSNTGASNNPAWAQINLSNGVTNTLGATNGGTAQSAYTLGDTLYASATNTLSRLAGNTTSGKQYLSQTGTGTVSAAPSWATISGADITGAALTEVNDTNVTLTLGGTPSTALLRPASITAGWTGQLAVGRGGTGLASGTSGGILGFTGSTTIASSGLLTANALLLGGGAGATPSALASLGTTTTVLHGNAAGAPTFGAVVLTTDVSGVLPGANMSAANLASSGNGGVTGNLPVTNLNSGTGASSSTFWRGDGTWVTPSGGGTVTSVAGNGVTITSTGTIPPPYGFVNCSLAASVSSNILTVAVKDNTGSDPSATSPANFYFRNVTASTGSWTQVTLTSALSITTNATGATLGSSNSTAFRFWVVVFNNAGTAVLGLINCSTVNTGAGSANIFPLNEGLVASSTPMSGSATSAGVFYTPNGTTITSKSFLILGYVEYNSTGLTTAGTYATGPNFIQTMGPGVRKPGEVVQAIFNTTSTQGTTASATFAALASGQSLAISPTSAANPIRALASGSAQCPSSQSATISLGRGTTAFGSWSVLNPPSGIFQASSSVMGYDLPNTTSSTTYQPLGKTSSGTMTYPVSGNAVLEVQEIMG